MGTEAEHQDSSVQHDGVVVVPAPRPRKGLASWALDLLESLVVRLGHDKTKPLHWLSGNFAPVVEETPPAPTLTVRGHLPGPFPSLISPFFSAKATILLRPKITLESSID